MSNKQPIYFLQTDPKWKDIPYAVKGEKATIGGSGCGPSSAAMIISTLTGQNVTPVDTCKWALEHGYKALNQGTYYSYFIRQFSEYGLECSRLNESRMIKAPNNKVHDKAFQMLKDGHYLIALMGPGTWTSNGHFVVVWWKDNVIHINDPASKKLTRLRGDIDTFRKECRMYWSIKITDSKKEDTKVTQEEFNEMMNVYLSEIKRQEPSAWSKESRKWAEALDLIAGDEHGDLQYKAPVTREQMVIFMQRLHDLK